MTNQEINNCMRIKLDDSLPEYPSFDPKIRRAPKRDMELSDEQIKLALKNALRYIPENLVRT